MQLFCTADIISHLSFDYNTLFLNAYQCLPVFSFKPEQSFIRIPAQWTVSNLTCSYVTFASI